MPEEATSLYSWHKHFAASLNVHVDPPYLPHHFYESCESCDQPIVRLYQPHYQCLWAYTPDLHAFSFLPLICKIIPPRLNMCAAYMHGRKQFPRWLEERTSVFFTSRGQLLYSGR